MAVAEWYFIDGDSPTTVRVEFEGKAMNVPVRKVDLRVEEIVLRRDTERADYFWLEVLLPETMDSDAHILVIEGRNIGQVFTRTRKWAIGFSSVEEGRRCLQFLRQFHRLDEKHVRDRTKE